MTPRKHWVSSPHSGGSHVPPALQEATRLRILAHAHAHYAGRFREIEVRFRGAFCYIDVSLEPEPARRSNSRRAVGKHTDQRREADPPMHLCRLRYFSGRGLWTVAFYTYSQERYEATFFPSGEIHGTPEEAFDLGAIYLQ